MTEIEQQQETIRVHNEHSFRLFGEQGEIDREAICMQCRIDVDALETIAKRYNCHLITEDRVHKSYSDWKRNFRNWIATAPKQKTETKMLPIWRR